MAWHLWLPASPPIVVEGDGAGGDGNFRGPGRDEATNADSSPAHLRRAKRSRILLGITLAIVIALWIAFLVWLTSRMTLLIAAIKPHNRSFFGRARSLLPLLQHA
jgi:hypothetical protein